MSQMSMAVDWPCCSLPSCTQFYRLNKPVLFACQNFLRIMYVFLSRSVKRSTLLYLRGGFFACMTICEYDCVPSPCVPRWVFHTRNAIISSLCVSPQLIIWCVDQYGRTSCWSSIYACGCEYGPRFSLHSQCVFIFYIWFFIFIFYDFCL